MLLFSCGCVPCEEVARGLEQAPDLKQQAGVAIVVTNRYAATPEAVGQFRQRSGFKGPMMADDGRVSTAFDALHCPRLWLLDAAGIARWSGKHGHDHPPELLVKELLTVLSLLVPPAPIEAGTG